MVIFVKHLMRMKKTEKWDKFYLESKNIIIDLKQNYENIFSFHRLKNSPEFVDKF
jgi:hypothetical protein